MKFRIKYSGNKKFTVTLENGTYGELLDAVKRSLITLYCISPDIASDVRFSLNGKDFISGQLDTALESLGIVPGDCLIVMDAAEAKTIAESEAPLEKKDTVIQKVTTDSIGESVGAFHAPVLDSMTSVEDIGLIESRNGLYPARVVKLFEAHRPCTSSEAVNLLFLYTMWECGYVVVNTDSKDNIVIPSDWRNLVMSVSFEHPSLNNFSCTFVLVTMGDMKRILASFSQQESELSVSIKLNDYVTSSQVNPITVSHLRKVSSLTREIRNSLLYPLQIAVHEALGIPAPWHLTGLPGEIIYMIMLKLNPLSLLSFGATCRRFHSEAQNEKLWKSLLRNDFASIYSSLHKSCTNYKNVYKDAFKNQKERQKRSNNPEPFFVPHVPLFPAVFPPPGRCPVGPRPFGPPPRPTPLIDPFTDPDSPYFMGEGEFPDPTGPLPFNPHQPGSRMPPRNRGPRFDFFHGGMDGSYL